MGGAPTVQAPQPPNPAQEYQQALGSYIQNAPGLYQEESKYQPLYNQMQQSLAGSNIPFYTQAVEGQMPQAQGAINTTQQIATQGALQNYRTSATQAGRSVVNASPQLQQLSQYGKQQIGASQDPVLQSLLGQVQAQGPGMQNTMNQLSAQAGTMFNPTNQTLSGLSRGVGQQTNQEVTSLTNLGNQAAANTRSPIFNQTAGTVMGQLGNLDPLTQQLSDTAQQQLSLGGQLSPQAMQDATQQARASYQARGMLNSTGSIASEVLNRDAVTQARLQQQEQFASGVSGLVQNEQQQRTGNALGLTSTDIAATQQNLALAGQMYQGAGGLAQSGAQIQGGLQQQIASNIQQGWGNQLQASQQGIQNQMANQQLAAGMQGSILDQMYRQQQAGAGALQTVYGAQQQGIGQITGAPNQGTPYATGMAGQIPQYGTGSPNLFQGSGLLSLVNQNQMAYYQAQASANQMNSQSKGAASGALISAGAGIASAAIVGVGGLLL